MPVSLTSEIARLENVDGQRMHDLNTANKVAAMSKIVIASSSEVWLVNCPGPQFNHFYNNDMEGLGINKIQEVFFNSINEMRSSCMSDPHDNQPHWNLQLYTSNVVQSFPITRASRNVSRQSADDSTISTPASETIISGLRHVTRHSTSSVSPQITEGRITRKNTPKQPIPQLDDVNQWIGQQLNHQRMPEKYMDTPPQGLLITQVNGYPDGLLAIPDTNGSPRIIVPKSQVEGLVLQCHEDIHHQSRVKVLHMLKSLFYWPGMSAEVEKICTACQTCLTASVRRKYLKTKFDLHASQSTAMPRQDNGIDFYGVYKEEIMAMVDLFTK
jgi:hypothetical protein